ncbi:amidohydrolase [Anaerococcus urinomassiliensis]|uniref:amidohydrolase n=1 Tax=Anaerococcus urinomassiliensis TaxID=1745712 RepID=UPI000AB667F2|nr:amidohydrolase [Anaerococcus urinomassiliensis]
MNIDEMINLRRYFHHIAEPARLEFKTTDKIIQELRGLDIELHYGKEIYFDDRLGLPDEKKACEYKNNINLKTTDKSDEILDSYTGLIAVIKGIKKGNNIGFRFDIDANDIHESDDIDHIPNKEGFRSTNDFAMHACGHDAHMAIGIAFTKYLAKNKDSLNGNYVVVFQPAEEGVKGAYALKNNPIFNDLDYFVGMHIGMKVPSGKIVVGSEGMLATKKFDINFEGLASHAGGTPEEGKNALLAASSAVMNFNSLTQHSKGASRLNVGTFNAGSGRNIVPNHAELKMEIRGENEDIIEYLKVGVERIVKGSAISYDCDYDIKLVGAAPSLLAYDEDFKVNLINYYKEKGYSLVDGGIYGSEDVAYFLNQVSKNNGKAMHFILGTNHKAGHHNEKFDIVEDDMQRGLNMLIDFVKYVNYGGKL